MNESKNKVVLQINTYHDDDHWQIYLTFNKQPLCIWDTNTLPSNEWLFELLHLLNPNSNPKLVFGLNCYELDIVKCETCDKYTICQGNQDCAELIPKLIPLKEEANKLGIEVERE